MFIGFINEKSVINVIVLTDNNIVCSLGIINSTENMISELLSLGIKDKKLLSIIKFIEKEQKNIKAGKDYLFSENDVINITGLLNEFKEKIYKNNQCISNIINDTSTLKNAIINYKAQMEEYVNNYSFTQEDIDKIQSEKNVLNTILNKSKIDFMQKINGLKNEIVNLRKRIDTIKNKNSKKYQKTKTELQDSFNKYKNLKSKMQNISYINKELNAEVFHLKTNCIKQDCINKITKEKGVLINKIKQYNDIWRKWANEHLDEKNKFYEVKLQLQNDYNTLKELFNKLETENYDLKKNIQDINIELNKVITNQISLLQEKEDEINYLKGVNNDLTEELNQLEKAHDLINKNKENVIEDFDYENCNELSVNLFKINNFFWRKQEIIKILDNIIENENIINKFNLDEANKLEIKTTFEKTKTDIFKLIEFLSIKKYLGSEYIQLLKNKYTQTQVPMEFCNNIKQIIDYYVANKDEISKYNTTLTNLYEDLSGAVRVYIRIKPSIEKTISTDGKDVSILCNGKYNNFTNFYKVFNDTDTNLDIYTGEHGDTSDATFYINTSQIENENSFYSLFSQISSGYSIVLFGYGYSGSGKTFSLLGNMKEEFGLLHYALANLKGVRKIKLKNCFEQYYSNVNINFNHIKGKIINLIKEIPSLRTFSRNENEEISKLLPNWINIDDILPEHINDILKVIQQHRLNKKRIKATPNNPESSRSHLYLIFSIEFDNGNIGHFTIIDSAGRESPQDIMEGYLTPNAKFGSILSPAGGIELVKKQLLDKDNSASDVYEILQEGIYINETINHLVYYLNKKNHKESPTTLQSSNPDKYSADKFYVKPYNEETTINESNNCLTIPILKYIDNLTVKNKNSFKPTKWVMMCMIRQESIYCQDSVNTLNFATSIKSS